MIKVLGIAGSPRKEGNSDLLLNAFLEGAASKGSSIEKIRVADLKVAPCDEGNSCHKTGVCRIKDDMQPLYSKLLDADHIVISTPTFFMGPPAQLKAMIDRCQALWARKFLLKKSLREDSKTHNGFLLSTAALPKKDAFKAAQNIIKAFFFVLGYKYKGELLINGVDKKGDIRNIKGALDEAFNAGAEINN